MLVNSRGPGISPLFYVVCGVGPSLFIWSWLEHLLLTELLEDRITVHYPNIMIVKLTACAESGKKAAQ